MGWDLKLSENNGNIHHSSAQMASEMVVTFCPIRYWSPVAIP